MLDPRPPPPSFPTIVPFLMNTCLFYDTIELRSGPDSITVDAILKRAGAWGGSQFGMSLRWITDENAAFVPRDSRGSLSRQKDDSVSWSRREDARAWYLDKGHCLASEPIETDESLRERLRGIRSGAGSARGIRLYVVGPADPLYWHDDSKGVEAGRRGCISDHRDLQSIRRDGDKDEDDSILTRMAALYEPAFAYAENALRGSHDVPLEGGCCGSEEGKASSVGAAVDDLDRKANDMLDARLLVAQLRDALNNLRKVGCSDSKEEGAHSVTLGKLFQQLFDDPTLKVNVKSSNVDGFPSTEFEIEAECPTPYKIPARYVVGRVKLMSARDAAEEAATDVQEGMLTYRDAVLKTGRESIYEATCCPCLVIGTAGATVQLFAAYFADEMYRTHLCDFELDAVDPADEHRDIAVAAKVRVIRNTARMLREAYGKVHTGRSLLPPDGKHTARPHLLPRPAILMPTPLPLHLYLLDRVNDSPYSDLFTGVLELPGPESARELPVHVKFVREYGVAAHRLLAEHRRATGGTVANSNGNSDGAGAGAGEPWPLAPQLYWAGEIVAGLQMIVMESLPRDARMVGWYSDRRARASEVDSGSGSGLARPEPVVWGELGDVRAAVRLLHEHGFVHGDIRGGNVMLQRPLPHVSDSTGSSTDVVATASTRGGGGGGGGGGGDTPRAYLVDFDWAGKEGEARYPELALNPDVEWPRPASELGGQLITKKDDIFMLERLLPQVSPGSESGREPRLERADNINVEKRKRKRDPDTGKRKRKRRHKHKQEDTSDKLKETKGRTRTG